MPTLDGFVFRVARAGRLTRETVTVSYRAEDAVERF
jgi:hypothetical protein